MAIKYQDSLVEWKQDKDKIETIGMNLLKSASMLESENYRQQIELEYRISKVIGELDMIFNEIYEDGRFD